MKYPYNGIWHLLTVHRMAIINIFQKFLPFQGPEIPQPFLRNSSLMILVYKNLLPQNFCA